MDRLDLHHPAITPKILRAIFEKTAKRTVIRLAQTSRLGGATFRTTYADLHKSFLEVEKYKTIHRWIPQTKYGAYGLAVDLAIQWWAKERRRLSSAKIITLAAKKKTLDAYLEVMENCIA